MNKKYDYHKSGISYKKNIQNNINGTDYLGL